MRIPKALKTAIRARLQNEPRPQSPADIANAVNPTVASGHRRSPVKMAFVLKQLKREGMVIIASEVKNGLTASGNERSRVEYCLNHEVEDPDVVEEGEE
jgi:hypothetical protein